MVDGVSCRERRSEMQGKEVLVVGTPLLAPWSTTRTYHPLVSGCGGGGIVIAAVSGICFFACCCLENVVLAEHATVS